MDSVNTGMSATNTNGLDDGGRIYPSLTEVDERVQHPECVVILSNIETLLMECVHTGIVTIISTKNDIF